jgi:4-amino-4-deoxy-L-arabinose transferase-like glycosyltransferase
MQSLRDLSAASFLIAIVAGFQIGSRAYQADFDATDDEPAHVVSSLMVRDYLASGRLLHPWKFATEYYIHYPKVAILHWPPVFHLSEAIWMFLAGRSRGALLCFQAIVGGTLAAGVFFWLRRDHAFWIAFAAAVVLATTRLMQSVTSEVAPELLLGTLVFWSVARFARYLDTGNSRDAWWFALLALASLGTHGRGAVLLLFPFVAMLLARLTMWRAIMAASVVLVYVFLPNLLGQAYAASPMIVLKHSGAYLLSLGRSLQWPVFFFALVGIAAGLRKRRNDVTVMIALILSCWIFHSTVNVPLAEYFLITAAPAMIVLAAGGASALWQASSRKWSVKWPVAVAFTAIFLGVCAVNIFRLQTKTSLGARSTVGNTVLYLDAQKVWLVAGTSAFEGALIAEVALRDRAMDHIVLRASKVLARSTWVGANYRLVFDGPAEVSGFLDEAHVGWIVVREGESVFPHIPQLETTIHENPNTWRNVALPSSSRGIALFERNTPLPGSPKIEIDMREKLRTVFLLP